MNPNLIPLLVTSHHPPDHALTTGTSGGGDGSGGDSGGDSGGGPGGSLLGEAVGSGYAWGIGTVGTPGPGQLINPAPLLSALRNGWTWGEAVALSTPTLNSTWRPIGDPLGTFPLPLAGWDIFGPVTRLEEITPDQPALALRDDERSVTLEPDLIPTPGQPTVYLIRHIDNLGRSELGSTLVRTTQLDQSPATPTTVPLSPVWPDVDGWPVTIEDAVAKPVILWDRPIGECDVQTIELIAAPPGSPGTSPGSPPENSPETTTVLQTLTPKHHQRSIRVEVTPPTAPGSPITLYWRITNTAGVSIDTPRSRTIDPATTPTTSLQVL